MSARTLRDLAGKDGTFTPWRYPDDERVCIPFDQVEVVQGDPTVTHPEPGDAEVIVRFDGKTWTYKRIPCSLPDCNCDAIVIPRAEPLRLVGGTR